MKLVNGNVMCAGQVGIPLTLMDVARDVVKFLLIHSAVNEGVAVVK